MKIHLGDADRAMLSCGAKEIKIPKNWSWTPEKVTCKRCLAIYRTKCELSSAPEPPKGGSR